MMKRVLSIAAASLLCADCASASLLTSDPGTGTTTTFTTTGLTTGVTGPVIIDGYTVTGSPSFAYGDSRYGVFFNGFWENFSYVATDDSSATVRFDLGGLYGFVGGFMNYSAPAGTFGTPVISAIAADGTTVLETYDLSTDAPIDTPFATNAGAFRGIQRTSNDIRYFELTGDYLVTHTIEVGSAAVPEPGTLFLAGVGLVGLVAARRRLKP